MGKLSQKNNDDDSTYRFYSRLDKLSLKAFDAFLLTVPTMSLEKQSELRKQYQKLYYLYSTPDRRILLNEKGFQVLERRESDSTIITTKRMFSADGKRSAISTGRMRKAKWVQYESSTVCLAESPKTLLGNTANFWERCSPNIWKLKKFYFHDIAESHRYELVPSYGKQIATCITCWRLIEFVFNFTQEMLRAAFSSKNAKP